MTDKETEVVRTVYVPHGLDNEIKAIALTDDTTYSPTITALAREAIAARRARGYQTTRERVDVHTDEFRSHRVAVIMANRHATAEEKVVEIEAILQREITDVWHRKVK